MVLPALTPLAELRSPVTSLPLLRPTALLLKPETLLPALLPQAKFPLPVTPVPEEEPGGLVTQTTFWARAMDGADRLRAVPSTAEPMAAFRAAAMGLA